jgi:CubicO group peptidase (beta-lactamase class C family)
MEWNELSDFLNGIGEKWGIPALECAVTINHERVYYKAAGYKDTAKTIPASDKDLYWVYSVSKLFAVTSAMQLIEQGLMSTEDLVSKYLPSWEHVRVKTADGSEESRVKPTIFHLLTMTCGLNYELGAPEILKLAESTGNLFTLRDLADALAKAPLDFTPGEHFRYSLCLDVLGAVVEVVSGLPMEEYVRQYIREPLGTKDLTYFPSEEQLRRFSTEYSYDEKTGSCIDVHLQNPFALAPLLASPGAGLASGLHDVALLADALANGGIAASGRRILTEESIRRMSEDSLTPAQKEDFAQMKPKPYSYGFGVRTLTRQVGNVPAGEFGWDGAAASYVLIDPSRKLSLVYMQHVLEHPRCFTELHIELRDTLYRIVTRP